MAPAPCPAQPVDMSEHITDIPHVRRLDRSADRVLAGVCSGLGRYFELNPAFFRLGFVVLTLLGGAGILVYLAAVFVIPDEGKERSLVEQAVAERRDHPWQLYGLAAAGIALVVLLCSASAWPSAGRGLLVVLVGGLVVLWAARGEHRPRRILRILTALLALVLALAIAAVALAFSWFDVSLGHGVGDRSYAPTSVSEIGSGYHLGVGKLTLDLSQIGPLERPVHLNARVDVGNLRIVVPPDLPVAVDGHAKAGDVEILERHASGQDASLHSGGPAQLTVKARVGLGEIDVVRAGR